MKTNEFAKLSQIVQTLTDSYREAWGYSVVTNGGKLAIDGL